MVWGRKGQVEDSERFAREAMTYIDSLYRVAFHLAKREEEAQDLVQETYLRALEAYEQFTQGTNMKAWMTRILYNLFFDRYHQKKRWVAVEDEPEGTEYGEGMAGENPGPEDHVLRQELRSKINEGLRKIPVEFRAPIILVDMGDFSYAEAAEILSCPLGTIRSRLSRGRRLLYQRLQGYIGVNKKGREGK